MLVELHCKLIRKALECVAERPATSDGKEDVSMVRSSSEPQIKSKQGYITDTEPERPTPNWGLPRILPSLGQLTRVLPHRGHAKSKVV